MVGEPAPQSESGTRLIRARIVAEVADAEKTLGADGRVIPPSPLSAVLSVRTYHWDTELTPGLRHSHGPHLQIHQPDGVIVRIFYGGAS